MFKNVEDTKATLTKLSHITNYYLSQQLTISSS